MFGKKKDQEINRLRSELENMRLQWHEEKFRAANIEAEHVRVKAENLEFQHKVTLFDGMSSPLGQFADSAKALQGSLAAMATAMKTETQAAVRTVSETAHSKEIVQKLVGRTHELIERAHQSGAAIETLHERTRQISGIVQLIKDVADQTNLLALNAAIEAARAGEQGRGFAVVADEVRKLAERTTHSAGEISELVSRVQAEAFNLKRVSDITPDELDAIQQDGNAAFANIDELLLVSQELTATLGATALRGFVETAKTDHLVFKQEIYRVFLGLSDKKAGDFTSHTACRLGNWYYEGDGKDCFSKLPGYREIEPPHQRVHEHGQSAVTAYRAGNIEASVVQLAEMERASMEVLAQLERMAKAGEDDPSVLCIGGH